MRTVLLSLVVFLAAIVAQARAAEGPPGVWVLEKLDIVDFWKKDNYEKSPTIFTTFAWHPSRGGMTTRCGSKLNPNEFYVTQYDWEAPPGRLTPGEKVKITLALKAGEKAGITYGPSSKIHAQFAHPHWERASYTGFPYLQDPSNPERRYLEVYHGPVPGGGKLADELKGEALVPRPWEQDGKLFDQVFFTIATRYVEFRYVYRWYPAGQTPPPPASISHGAPPAEPTPAPPVATGWVSGSVGNVAVSVPSEWKPLPGAPAGQGGWYKGTPQKPEASVAILRGKAVEDALKGISVQTKEATTVDGHPATSHTGRVPGATPTKGELVVVQPPAAGGEAVGIFVAAPEADWPKQQGTFAKIISSVRIGGPVTPAPPPTPFGTGEPAQVDKMTLQIGKRRVRAGESVTVPVWLLRGQDVANMNVSISYDPQVAGPAGPVVKGSLIEKSLFEGNAKEPGVVRVGFAGTAGISGTGTLAQIPFKANGQPGDNTALRPAVTTINSAAGAKVAIATLDGEIQIVGADGEVPGDADGDGALSAGDALAALRMSVKAIPVRLAVDLDKDGQVTSNDARLILQRVVGK